MGLCFTQAQSPIPSLVSLEHLSVQTGSLRDAHMHTPIQHWYPVHILYIYCAMVKFSDNLKASLSYILTHAITENTVVFTVMACAKPKPVLCQHVPQTDICTDQHV